MEVKGQTRVAILEDHSLMRQSLSDMLEEAGFQVVGQYSDPNAFLARVPIDQPAVAIIDLGLQDAHGSVVRDGVEVVQELRQRHPDVQLLVFSGNTESEVVDRCYREGVAGYLDKLTSESEAVINAVRAVARGERLFPLHLLDSPFKSRPPPQESALLRGLSVREREVLTYVAAGADNLKIATLLDISERTVKAHVSSLYRKLGSENRTQLAILALQLGVRPCAEV